MLAASAHAEPPPRYLDRTGLIKTFADEFDSFSWYAEGPALGVKRPGTWRTQFGNQPDPNAHANRAMIHHSERQIYVDPAFRGLASRPLELNAFTVHDGILRLTTDRAPPELQPFLYGQKYTSGLMTTRLSFSQLYGVFEMRARLPKGRGLWPAFWLVPADGSWPPEIDIFETLGQEPSVVYTTVHSKAQGKYEKFGKVNRVADTSADFHTYAVDWQKEEIAFYFDDVEIFRTPTPADLHKPMYMIINVAVGGWPGDPDETTRFPVAMEIDWVRVWRR
jgi:hypothetical protein